jgi:tRNA(fMet)-specific endonuclease VapC
MSRVLVDTSAYSAFLRGHPPVERAIQEADELYLNAIVLGELLAGFGAGKRRARNEKDLETFLASPRVGVLDLDGGTAQRYAAIANALRAAGTPIPTNDLWIASTAMQHGLRILTTDEHYLAVSQVLVDHYFPSATI